MRKLLKPLLLAALLPGLFIQLQAQEVVQTIRGTVIDKDSKEPLYGVNVVVDELDSFTGTTTDMEGQFRIEEVPVGRVDLKITYIGYQEKVLQDIMVVSGKETVLTIELQQGVSELGEVVVSASKTSRGDPVNSLATVSAQSFTLEQSERFAASINDPGRMVLSFAGVKGTDDVTNSVTIRGNNPKFVQWRIEGIDVPYPNHFTMEGGAYGAVAMISNNVLDASDFYTSAFPAEYGNSLSGIFDLHMRKGNNEKRQHNIQVGMMGLEGATEGPFTKKKKGSYLVSYRYSTLSLLGKMGFNIGNTTTQYQDLNFKLHFPTEKTGQWSVFGVGGLSALGRPSTYNRRRRQETKTYDMGVVGVTNLKHIGKNTYLKSILSYATNREQYIMEEEVANGSNMRETWRYRSFNHIIRGSFQWNTVLSKRSTLRYGLVGSWMKFNMREGSNHPDFGYLYAYRAGTFTGQIEGYAQWKFRPSTRLTVNTGLHLNYFLLTQSQSIEPRFGLKYQLSDNHVLSFGAGVHSRIESLSFYATLDIDEDGSFTRPNANLGMMKAAHLVAGHEWAITDNFVAKTELYFQYLYDVPVDARDRRMLSAINFDGRYPLIKLDNDGAGMNYGVDLTLQRFFAGNYYILANASLFRSRFRSAAGDWYHTKWDAGYITNLTAGKDFNVGKRHKNNVIGLNTRILWSGGYRLVDTNYEEQIKDYFRLDFRFSYRRNKEKYSWDIGIDIQNVTNRLNEDLLSDIDPSGIIPVARYRVEF